MRFKLDENLPVAAASLLTEHGHDALSVHDEDLVGRSDEVVSGVARAEGRVLVTFDSDFADERAYPPGSHAGSWCCVRKSAGRRFGHSHATDFRPSVRQDGHVILEHAVLNVVPEATDAFEEAFNRATAIIASMPGFITLKLGRCIESPTRYLLLVEWATLEDHTEGFRGSTGYKEWRGLLHHFYLPFPVVEHFEAVLQL